MIVNPNEFFGSEETEEPEEPQGEVVDANSFFGGEQEKQVMSSSDFFGDSIEPELSTKQKLALDFGRAQAGSAPGLPAFTGGGFTPESGLFSARNVLFQGLEGFFSGIPKGLATLKEARLGTSDEIGSRFTPTIKPKEGSAERIKNNPLYKFGELIGEAVEETFPEKPELQGQFLASTLPRGFGTAIGITGSTFATGGFSTAAMASLSFSSEEYDQAIEAGASEEDAFDTFLMNLPIQGLQAVPVARAIKRMDKLTGGTFKQVMKGAGIASIEEATEETVQTYLSNVVAKEFYDESRKVTDGLAQAAGAGFIIGGVLGGSLGAVNQQLADPDLDPSMRLEILEARRSLINDLGPRLDDGKQTYFHGTPNKFIDFDPNFLASTTEQDDAKLGFHFTNDRETAQKVFSRGGEVKEVVLDINNTFDIVQKSNTITDQDIKELGFLLSGEQVVEGDEYYDIARQTLENLTPSDVLEFKDAISDDAEVTRRRMKALGYDSIQFKLAGDVNETIVFDPKKIKISAKERINKLVEEGNNIMNAEGNIEFDIAENLSAIDSDQRTLNVPFKEDVKIWTEKGKAFFRPRGGFPVDLFNAKVKFDGERSRAWQEMRFKSKKLEREFNKHTDRGVIDKLLGRVDEELLTQIDDALHGKTDIDTLPDGIREATQDMRDHIDALSRRYIKDGIVEGDLEAAFVDRFGSYIHRTYQKHLDPKWARKVPEGVRNRAKAFIRDRFKSEFGEVLTPTELENAIDQLLFKEDGAFFSFKGKNIGTKDMSTLKKRANVPEWLKTNDDVAPEIRALWGEVKDPFFNYSMSVTKMTNLLASHRFLGVVAQEFKGTYFFDADDLGRPLNHNAPISAKGNEALAPLDGLVTSPEIKEAFEESFANSINTNRAFALYLQANAMSKYAKTVLNPITHFRNLYGGVAWMIRNGVVPNTSDFREAWSATRKNLTDFAKDNETQEVLRLTELNLLDKSARGGELDALLDDISQFKGNPFDSNFNFLISDGVWNRAKIPFKFAAKLYQAEDNFIRVAFFKAELRRQRKIDPDITEEQVAELINDTYQNYDRVPKAVQSFRRFPILGPFISFQYETVRTMGNTISIGLNDIKSDNRKRKALGYKRLAGALASTTATTAASLFSMYALGITDREDKDNRRFMAPWDKDAVIAYLPGGRYINLSYSDPSDIMTRPITTMITGGSKETATEQFITGLGKSMEPIIGPEILSTKITEAVANKKYTGSGASVYNPQAPVGDQWADITAHLWSGFEPGVLRSVGNLTEGATGEGDRELGNEVMALFGMRSTKLDPEQSLPFIVNDYNKAIRDARRLYTSVAYNNASTRVEKVRAYQDANREYRRLFNEMNKTVRAANRLGISKRKLENILTKAGISGVGFERVFYNDFQEFNKIRE